ncbi:uncharacterized protein LOC121049003 [Rosa chinensis]|uniref:uncharacterized protein LOC121049003 n=1 Tax=Rosa chinensis TaxID=74649 RepID=UPI001AD8E4D5|nr:uncharacterized protein LOC121049003 [Rosa chinensis]
MAVATTSATAVVVEHVPRSQTLRLIQTQMPPFSPTSWSARPAWSNGLLGPGPQRCFNCKTNQHGLNQCPHCYSGPTTTPPFAGAHFLGDPNWYPDTGATHHMTAMPLQNSQPYGGPHNVYMGPL